MPVPLDKMQVVTANNQGVQGQGNNVNSKPQPSLHPSRMEKMVFVKYLPPPANADDRAEYDVWLERVNYLCDDLHWLLQLPHDKFWCQVVFDAGLHKALDSFLQYSRRSHDAFVDLPAVGKQRQLELCRLVFITYLRMSTHKESKDHFITPEVFGEILYENFLFDIPKIFDICSLFGESNGPLLSKMVGNIFTQQPKYINDLSETVPTILQVFSNIAAKCGIHLEGVGLSPQKLDVVLQATSLSAIPSALLEDVVLYLSDTAITLHRLVDVYPPACSVFNQFHFCSLIANFYESVIPEITVALKQHEFSSASLKKQLTSKLRHTKKSLLATFHSIVQHVCLQPVLENANNEEIVAGCTEEFLHVMTSVLGERKFLAAFEGMFSFHDDVCVFVQASSSIDASQFEYIQTAINSAFATFGHRKAPKGNTNTGGRTSPDGAPDFSAGGATAGKSSGAGVGSDKWSVSKPHSSRTGKNVQDDFQSEDYGAGAVSHPRPSDIEMESLITSVKDLFPHIGEGFIEIALEELDWDQERVVSCILEEKLPPSLQDIGTDLPRQQREMEMPHSQTDQTDVLDSRRNVFDNDEFDMFRNKDVDMTKIHLGKKEKKIDLDDKSIVNAVRATYDLYGSMDKENMYDYIAGGQSLEHQMMYEDEYDDTYDSNAVGADDADSADELTNKKIVPRVLMDLERKKAKDEGQNDGYSDNDGEDNGEDEDSKRVKDQFVADPAKLREQAEQRRQSQTYRGPRPGAAPVNRDVKGGQKGQGQSKEVLHNRNVKKKFKGQRNQTNADKKMSKGMF